MGAILEVIGFIFVMYLLFSPSSGTKKDVSTPPTNSVETEMTNNPISQEQIQKVNELNSKVDEIWENSQKATDPDRFKFSNVEYDDYFGDEGLVIVMTFVVENVQQVTSTLYLSQFVLRKDGEGTLGYERHESGISDTIKKPVFKNWLSDLLPGDKKVCRLSFHTTDTTPNGWTLYYKDHLNGNKLKAVATISE